MSDASAARRLARFVLGLRLRDLPPAVVEQAALLSLDTLGSCLASSTMDFGVAVTRVAVSLGASRGAR